MSNKHIEVFLKDGTTVLTFNNLCNRFNYDNDKLYIFTRRFDNGSEIFLGAVPYDNILFIKNKGVENEHDGE